VFPAPLAIRFVLVNLLYVQFITPMQPVLSKVPFSDPNWLFEPKWDGYRALCFVEHGALRFVSRNRVDLTKRFPELKFSIKADQALLDGEIVALDQNGMPCFDALRGRLRKQCYVVYHVFDLLYLNGEDFTNEQLIIRKGWLGRIIPKIEQRIRNTEYVIGEGEALFKELERLKLEGMVAKKLKSTYVSGRSNNWLKIKTGYGRQTQQKRSEMWKR
jgi:bifunctional non-homologous end joining protein LigD